MLNRATAVKQIPAAPVYPGSMMSKERRRTTPRRWAKFPWRYKTLLAVGRTNLRMEPMVDRAEIDALADDILPQSSASVEKDISYAWPVLGVSQKLDLLATAIIAQAYARDASELTKDERALVGQQREQKAWLRRNRGQTIRQFSPWLSRAGSGFAYLGARVAC